MRPSNRHDGSNGWVAVPQLSDLIHGCLQYRPDGSEFHWFVLEEQKDGQWASGFDDFIPLSKVGKGATPEESVAETWMILKVQNDDAKTKA